jgi:hypothetical protein
VLYLPFNKSPYYLDKSRWQRKRKTNAWDIAKPLLVKDLLSGFVDDKMARGVVHKKRPEYEAVPMELTAFLTTTGFILCFGMTRSDGSLRMLPNPFLRLRLKLK